MCFEWSITINDWDKDSIAPKRPHQDLDLLLSETPFLTYFLAMIASTPLGIPLHESQGAILIVTYEEEDTEKVF